jgi:hypothetical protein
MREIRVKRRGKSLIVILLFVPLFYYGFPFVVDHEKDIKEFRDKLGIGPEHNILLWVGLLVLLFLVYLLISMTISYFYGLAEDKKNQEMWEKKQKEWEVQEKKRKDEFWERTGGRPPWLKD